MMEDKDVAAYLAAAAWADGPISDQERGLVENLLYSLGLERYEAAELLKGWEFKAPTPPDLSMLTDRAQGIALLRALLILSYSDGHFGIDELPYLTKVLDKFKVPTEELVQLRIQAQFYLDPEAASIEISSALAEAGLWDEVAQAAVEQKAHQRVLAERKIREELKNASETSLLVTLYRGRSFDVSEARAEFEKRRADLTERHGPMSDSQLLQTQIALLTMGKWDRLYADRCGACGLAAPGRKGSICPRCQEDYS